LRFKVLSSGVSTLKGRDGVPRTCPWGEPNNPFVARAMRVLSGEWSAFSRAVRLNALSGLVGLGPGSTPSGMTSSRSSAGRTALSLLWSAEAKAVADSLEPMIPWSKEKKPLDRHEQTTDAGKTCVASPPGALPQLPDRDGAVCLCGKGKQEIADAVESAVACGATSGTDALTGFLVHGNKDLINRLAF